VQEEPNWRLLAIDNPAPAATWAVFSQPAYPGWEVWCSGEKLETARAYGFLMAAKIPPGKSTIELLYRPKSFIFGWLLALGAIWVCALLTRFAWRGCSSPWLWFIWCVCGAMLLGVASVGVWQTTSILLPRIIEFGLFLVGGVFFVFLPKTQQKKVS
jgi:hypothetical protein